MDKAFWAASPALAFQRAWRWLRLPFDVFFFGTAMAPAHCQTLIFLCQAAFRQIASINLTRLAQWIVRHPPYGP